MTDMDATEKREVIEGFLDHIDAMTERINHLHQRVTALEAAREPAPAPVMSDETVEAISDALTDWGMVRMTPTPTPETVTISRDQHEAARATISELMNTIREIAIYADEERYNANASAYLSLTKVVELAQVTRRKYGDILPE